MSGTRKRSGGYRRSGDRKRTGGTKGISGTWKRWGGGTKSYPTIPGGEFIPELDEKAI